MWELDISQDRGKTWTTVKRGGTCKSCKVYAHRYYPVSHYISRSYHMGYRLYVTEVQGGEQLVFVSSNNTSSRIFWQKGNLKSRKAQPGKYVP